MATTLDESLRDDLNELDSDSDSEEEQQQQQQQPSSGTHEQADSFAVPQLPSASVKKTVNDVAKLRSSRRYKEHMSGLERHGGADTSSHMAPGGAAYSLVMESNRLVLDIEEEVATVFKFLVDVYSFKFPELQRMVKEPLQFAQTVKHIGNEMDLTLIDLTAILPNATAMIVTVTGSTTSGKALSEEDLARTLAACDEILGLDEDKKKILRFVEDRMHVIAPNVSAIVGTSIAAQLLAVTGGLQALTKVPSCNVKVVGKVQTSLNGFSSRSSMANEGMIYNCDLVQGCPVELRKKAMRVISGRVTLAARLDSTLRLQQGLPAGNQGRIWREEIEGKIEQWQQKGKGKTKKALPVPDAQKTKRRGGKDHRRMKERLGLTNVRKEANRMDFGTGTDEYGDSAMGRTLGRLGKEGSGVLRVTKKEQKLAKRKLQAINVGGGSGVTSGLASSIAFTPVQGIELVNPEAAAKRIKEANSKYFGTSKGFGASRK